VLVLRHEPGNADPRGRFDGTANTVHAYFRTKAENAFRRGAVGLLLVDDPLGSGPEEDLSLPVSYSLEAPAAGILSRSGVPGRAPQRELAGKLIANTGLDLRGLQEAVDAGRGPAGLPWGPFGPACAFRFRKPGPSGARNVVGFLAGADPALRGQWLLIGAHHDHLGTGEAAGETAGTGSTTARTTMPRG